MSSGTRLEPSRRQDRPASRLAECETVMRLVGVAVPSDKLPALESMLTSLREGYAGSGRWKKTRRHFGETLEAAAREAGDAGVKYCLVHLFLDALHRDQDWVNAKKAELHLSKKFESQELPQDARLELLLTVQANFPAQMKEAEELGAALKEKEGEVLELVARAIPQ